MATMFPAAGLVFSTLPLPTDGNLGKIIAIPTLLLCMATFLVKEKSKKISLALILVGILGIVVYCYFSNSYLFDTKEDKRWTVIPVKRELTAEGDRLLKELERKNDKHVSPEKLTLILQMENCDSPEKWNLIYDKEEQIQTASLIGIAYLIGFVSLTLGFRLNPNYSEPKLEDKGDKSELSAVNGG